MNLLDLKGVIDGYIRFKYRYWNNVEDIRSEAYLILVSEMAKYNGPKDEAVKYIMFRVRRRLKRFTENDKLIRNETTRPLLSEPICHYSQIDYETLEYIEHCLDDPQDYKYIKAYLYGFTQREIAKMFGVSKTHVHTKLGTLIRRLSNGYESGSTIGRRDRTYTSRSDETAQRVQDFDGRSATEGAESDLSGHRNLR